jgi:hypothetical protein
MLLRVMLVLLRTTDVLAAAAAAATAVLKATGEALARALLRRLDEHLPPTDPQPSTDREQDTGAFDGLIIDLHPTDDPEGGSTRWVPTA